MGKKKEGIRKVDRETRHEEGGRKDGRRGKRGREGGRIIPVQVNFNARIEKH